jgi:hypothetical protein
VNPGPSPRGIPPFGHEWSQRSVDNNHSGALAVQFRLDVSGNASVHTAGHLHFTPTPSSWLNLARGRAGGRRLLTPLQAILSTSQTAPAQVIGGPRGPWNPFVVPSSAGTVWTIPLNWSHCVLQTAGIRGLNRPGFSRDSATWIHATTASLADHSSAARTQPVGGCSRRCGAAGDSTSRPMPRSPARPARRYARDRAGG